MNQSLLKVEEDLGFLKNTYIKLSVNVIAPLLTNFYNQCITTGCVPDILKIAQVIPLLH